MLPGTPWWGCLVKFGSLKVRTPDGGSREYPIDLPSLIVGRADGNGIVIDDLSISRRHARIVIESGRMLVEDLGSAAGTFVDGHRVDPGTTNLVEDDQALRFGDVVAQFLKSPPGSANEAEAAAAALAQGAGTESFEDAPGRAISVMVNSPPAPVEPGGAVFATAVVHNRGRVVDLVTLGITGVPSTWVTFSQSTLALVPGARETVTLVFQPPINSQSLAGEYDFGLSVASGEHDREAVAFGKLTVTAFEASELHLSPVRAKRDFVVVGKNNGNALVTYALSGIDDEANFIFDFQSPSIELQPGQEQRIPLRVRRKKRQWFGRTTFMPLRVVATPTAGAGIDVEAPGQLVVQPPLERWKTPVLLALVIGLLALAGWLSWVYRDRLPTWIPWSTKGEVGQVVAGSPEAAYSGVHMCDKSEAERDAKLAKATALPAGTSGAPLFAQNNPAWADIEYAKAKDPEFGPDWCGTTIEQCGCAMTSVATIMALFNILTMPDGSELTPKTVNDWFNADARKTARGWVSRGYIYGDVIWTAANELSGEIARQRPGSPTLRFAGFGPGTDEEIRAELQAGRPLVLEVPGHYIAAVGLDGDKILINDPYYADRRTLDAYKGKVKGSVHFEPSNDLSGVVITVPKDLRVRVLDKSGKVVGSLSEPSATQPAPVGIDGAYLSTRNAWRDPTCVESPPPADAGTTSIFLPGNRDDYRIEVLNPSAGGTSVAIHSYDHDGNAAVETRDATGPSVLSLSYDPAKAEAGVQVIQGATPGAGSGSQTVGSGTPQLPGGGNTGGGSGVSTPLPSVSTTAAPSASPTATRTPVPTPTPVAPAAVTVKCETVYTPVPKSAGVTCTGTISGTYTTTRWSLNGLPAPVPPGSTAFSTTFNQDATATVEMTVCNITVCKTGSASVVVKFTTATPTASPTPLPGTPTPAPTAPPVGPPPLVHIECTWSGPGAGAQIDCATTFAEAYNTITWDTTNATPATLTTGSKSFQAFRSAAADATVRATVCLGAACTVSNTAEIPGHAFITDLVLLDDTPTCNYFSEYTLTAFFGSWTPGDPVPAGVLHFDNSAWGFVIDVPVVMLANGKPGAAVDFYFESPFDHSIAVSYDGDGNWPADSLAVTVYASSCG